MTCGLEKLGLVDQNWLQRDLSTLLLRTLAVGTRQQSETIEVALDMESRNLDEQFRHWSVLLLVKCRIICLCVTLQELENFWYQPISFRCSRLVGPGKQGFVAIWIHPCWFE